MRILVLGAAATGGYFGGRIETDHIVGDLLRRGAEQGVETPHLGIAFAHLKAYETRRDRAAGTAAE